MQPELAQKQDKLFAILRDLDRVIVAFSGGTDSAYLAWAANQVLGDKALAVTADSASIPESHKRDAEALEAFRRALKFDPDQVEALFQLGVVLARLHRYAEAVEAWQKVTRVDPAGPFAQRARVHARTALDLKHIFASDAA